MACDRSVIALLKSRTIGNVARLRAYLVEEHTKEWMVRWTCYLSELRKLHVPARVNITPMHPVPGYKWLMSIYVRDFLPRLDEAKARVTSIFGDILKMDTKKITKKLAGNAADTATWVTNVGNEHGQVLMSVLTEAEGDCLQPMADGLVRRYRESGKAPPKVLYVNRDCCSTRGQPKAAAMFGEWNQLVVRLDVRHLMRRFARGVTTPSHKLYGLFMARLSSAIFVWDHEDYARLKQAKQSQEGGDADPSLSPKELARHCRRHTRGAAETERLLQEVLDYFWKKKDSLGVPLFDRTRMEEIWGTQRQHLACIQDPEGVQLYTETGHVTRGGVELPVFRCARGSTSLESFHTHLCRLIPGTSVSALHYQVFLLEGLVRWNEDRARAAVEGAARVPMRCYSSPLLQHFKQLTQKFCGLTLVENYTRPNRYTGELIGIQYLFEQTGSGQIEVLDPDVPDGSEEDEAGDGEMAGQWEEDERFDEVGDLQHLLEHNISVSHLLELAAAAAPPPPPPSPSRGGKCGSPSASRTAAEPLTAARVLAKEPVQPDQPMDFHLPEDASGQAVTRRGPLAPALYRDPSPPLPPTAIPSTSTASSSTPSKRRRHQ